MDSETELGFWPNPVHEAEGVARSVFSRGEVIENESTLQDAGPKLRLKQFRHVMCVHASRISLASKALERAEGAPDSDTLVLVL